jgi:hypothetical protein
MALNIPYKPPASSGPTGNPSLYDEFDDACSILVPVDIIGTPGVLVSMSAGGLTLPEDPSDQWVATGKTYVAGERVHVPSAHRVYEATGAANNLGKNPTLPANQYNAAGVATFWIDVGPTNRAAGFDGLVSTPLVADSPLVITLTPGAFNGFAMFGVKADSFSVTVKDAPGGDVIYGEPITALEGSRPADYYEYFFDRFKPLTQVVRTGLSAYSSSEITITLSRATGQVQLGMLAIGDLKPVGVPLKGVSVEPMDFSSIVQDRFGNASVRRRANSTGMTISTVMDEEDANSVLQTIKETLGVPCVVIGSGASLYEWMTVFGTISASMSDQPYPFVTLKITVRGFI